MKLFIQKLPLSENSSFMAHTFTTPDFETSWHYHEKEFEIVLITKGSGTMFIGNSISEFNEGALVFIAPGLPHLFKKGDNEESASDIVVHYTYDFMGKEFFDRPELRKISEMFESAKQGIQIKGIVRDLISEKLKELIDKNSVERLILLLEILNLFSISDNNQLLSMPDVKGQSEHESALINKIYEFSIKHFHEVIKLKEVADLVYMSESAFSKYFKNRTKKNYSTFIAELRIGKACKLLQQNNLNITQICYESGFNNQSNFIKQFKKITGKTPMNYRQSYQCTT